MLAYLIKLIKKNDADLLLYKDDVDSVAKAENVMLDAMQGDLKQLVKEVERIKDAAKKAGDAQRGDDGKLVNSQMKITLNELREQKTTVRQVSGIKFYNQMEHDVEHTPMEIFSFQAEGVTNGALKRIKETQESYVSVLHYFGEDDKMTTSDFFGTLKKFFLAFEAVKDDVERQEENRVSYFLPRYYNLFI